MFQVRYAIRALLRRPVLSLTVVATVAIGVGANAVVFSLIDAVLLRPLPFSQPRDLVQVWQTHPTLGNLPVTYQDFNDWKQAKSFSAIETYTFQVMNKVTLLGQGAPEQIQATMVSPGLLPMLGISTLRGRTFTAEEDTSKQRVALISEAVWRRKFGADPGIVGRTIRIGPLGLTVVGILRQRDAFPVWADLWLPLSMLEPQLRQTRRFHPLEVVARLKSGVTLAQAQAEMNTLAAANAKAYPASNRNMGANAMALLDQITGPVRALLLIVWMAVGLILLIASANVAHLLLTRTSSRRRELAVRASLGASWVDLAKLLVTESLVLVTAGSVVGALAAAFILPALRSIAQNRVPRSAGIAFDVPVLLFTMVAAFLTAAIMMVPSLVQILRRDLHQAARQTDAPPFAGRGNRFGSVLMVSEIALSFVVLGSALLLMRSFISLAAVNPGFDGANVLAVTTTVPVGPKGWQDSTDLFENRIAPAIRALPGVEAVATGNMAPMTLDRTETSRFASRFGVAGVKYPDGAYPVAQLRWVSEEYFKALQIPLLRGRLLNRADGGKLFWVINETLAKQYFPGQDPVGRELLTEVFNPEPTRITIAGVVRDVRDLSLDTPPPPTAYQIATSPLMTILVRASREAAPLAASIESIVRQAAPEAPILSTHTVGAIMAASMTRYRLALQIMIAFAGIAAVLAMIGIYGVVAYSVGRRMREFGVRTAVGARPGDLVVQVATEGLRLAAFGIAGGLVMFAAVSRLFRGILFEIQTMDGISLAASGALVLLIALAALSIPAMRAARVDPSVALREG